MFGQTGGLASPLMDTGLTSTLEQNISPLARNTTSAGGGPDARGVSGALCCAYI